MHYLAQEGLQIIPVQNWLVTSRIIPYLEPRKGRRSSQLLYLCWAHAQEAGLPVEAQGLGQVARPKAVGLWVLLQVGSQN